MLLHFSISLLKIILVDQYADFMTHKWFVAHNLKNTGLGE